METNLTDEILLAAQCENLEKISSLIGAKFKDISSDEGAEEIFKSIAKALKEYDNGERLKEIIRDKENDKVLKYNASLIATHLHDYKFDKECVLNREKYGIENITSNYLIDLVKDKKNRDWAVQKAFEIYKNDRLGVISEILSNSNDVKFIVNAVKSRPKSRNIKLAMILSKTNDDNGMREFISNPRNAKYYIGFSDANEIYMKNYILEIAKYGKTEYIKSILDGKVPGIYFSDDFNINPLLIKLDDQNYYKRYIKQYEKDKLGTQMGELLPHVKDKKFVIEYIKKFCEKKNISIQTITPKDLVEIFTSLNDPEITKEFIAKFQELGLTGVQYDDLILTTRDTDFIRDCVKNKEKYQINEEKFAVKAVKNNDSPEEIEKFGISTPIPKSAYYLFHGDMEQALNKIQNNQDSNFPQIDLPEEMSIGIEVESIGPFGRDIRNKHFIFGWRSKSDETIMDDDGNKDKGVEVVSPVLVGDNKERTLSIINTVSFLKDCGQHAHKSCGGHMHFGAKYLDTIQSVYNFLELYLNNEEMLYIMSNAKGELPRNSVCEYAEPISKKFYNDIEEGKLTISKSDDIETFKQKLLKWQGNDKYNGINFKHLVEGGIGTIEIRFPNSTVDSKVWIENLNLFGGIFRGAKEISIIQEKPENERTDEEIGKLKKFEIATLPDNEENREQKLNALLDLCVKEKNKQIYVDRYNENNKLLNDSLITKINFGQHILKDKKISFKKFMEHEKNYIRNMAYCGENPATLEGIVEAEKSIESNIKEKGRTQNNT